MWFQRLVEIEDDSEPESIPNYFQQPTTVRSTVKTKKPKVPVSTPADFQRVRLMSTLRLKEQRAKEDRDRTYAKRLEEDLRKAGLDLAQIDGVMKEEADAESSRPSFTRMARRWLSIETLNQYGLDYEFDKV